jgi:cytochrome c oxidase subunit 2
MKEITMRRTFISALIAYAAVAIAISTIAFGSGSLKERVIKIGAKKFEFSPAEITVKKGEPVVLEINSEDVKHGFTLPDFGVRTDIKPGTVNRVTFTPDKVGSFTFACDVFCGAGHEEMSGTLNVTE